MWHLLPPFWFVAEKIVFCFHVESSQMSPIHCAVFYGFCLAFFGGFVYTVHMKQQLEQLIREAVSAEFGSDISQGVVFSVAYPPKPGMGDYASNVALILAKKVGENPKMVAEKLSVRMFGFSAQGGPATGGQFSIFKGTSEADPVIEKIEVLGGFINFTLTPKHWFAAVLNDIHKKKDEYGKILAPTPERIMVEYLSPNTNKPLHLGHLRNGITGASVINLLSATGQEVIKAEIVNDRGIHICKAMLAYQRWGNGATPESTNKKADHFFGDWYVRFATEAEKDESLQTQAQDMLRKWEAGDPEVRKLWLTVRQWVLDGWKQTEGLLGFTFDKVYFESDVYELGRDIIEQGLERGVFRKIEKGNIVFDLPVEEFGKDANGNSKLITVLRADGTSLYYTQDIGLQTSRVAEYNLDRIVHVVGSEQDFYFKALFAIFKALGYVWAEKLYHLSYAMVYLPEGKMKSREGTVVDADDLIAQVTDLAKLEIQSRQSDIESEQLTDEEVAKRAQIIALAAIKYYMLKQKPVTDIYFDPKESISFEGNTGPYCQYTYARAKSIIRQVMNGTSDISTPVDYSLLGDVEERALLQKLAEFQDVISRAASEYNPAYIATHVFETAQAFNSFYTTHSVMKAETNALREVRLQMVIAATQVIKNGLALLGIETLEEM